MKQNGKDDKGSVFYKRWSWKASRIGNICAKTRGMEDIPACLPMGMIQ